jgi:NifB/MoaA-like Fe-S oxidoreductase
MQFENWLHEVEYFSLRSEKIFDDLILHPEKNDADQFNNIIEWLRLAYDAGHLEASK